MPAMTRPVPAVPDALVDQVAALVLARSGLTFSDSSRDRLVTAVTEALALHPDLKPEAFVARLARDAQRLDGLIQAQGWTLVGGTPLFRLYDAGDAHAAQARLATAQIWSRVFTAQPGWLRLGLPGDETEWTRLAAALAR